MAKSVDDEHNKARERKPFSFMGIIHDGRVTDEDIEEVISEWSKSELP